MDVRILKVVSGVLGLLGIILLLDRNTAGSVLMLYMALGALHLFFQLVTFERVGPSMKLVLFISFYSLTAFMVVTSIENGMTSALAHLWYLIFCLGLESKNNGTVYFKTLALTMGFWTGLVSFRLLYSGGETVYFTHPFHTEISMVAGLIFALLGLFVGFLERLRVQEAMEENEKTIDWFTTLVNLVSHNLRSPLATILGNIQLLEAKGFLVGDSTELKRIKMSVDTLEGSVDRLLKATFVMDRNSELDLRDALKKTYPQIKISGIPKELTYKQNVSILLSLEVFLDNAFRFSPDKVLLTFNESGIEIRDFGKGMSESEIGLFGQLNNNTLGTLHGIGIPFAIRILDSIGYCASAENANPGLKVTMCEKSTSA